MSAVSSRRAGPRRPALRSRAVGVSVPRLDGHGKVTGGSLYLDDLRVAGVLTGRTVRSTIPRGRIKRIELDPAFDWTGVVLADHKDIPGENIVALVEDDQPLLAVDEVRHVDEPILLLAHEDAERAQAALAAVHVEYEPLEPVLTIEQSLAVAATLYRHDNVFKEVRIAKGDADRALAQADIVVEGVYRTGAQEHIYIETQAMLAARDANGGITVRGSLQCPYFVHRALARILALPPEKVRVVQTVTGGGFGGKEEYPSMIGGHAALLAWKSGRPVKIVYDRMEDIAATTKRHPARIRIRTAVDPAGILLAHDIDVVLDGGAYVTMSPVVLSRGALHAAGPYVCPHVSIRARAVATNLPPNGAFRGFGAPQTQFAIECHLNRVAERIGLDPLELRRRNAYEVGDVTPTGQRLRESVGALAVLERATARAGYAAKRRRYARANAAAERAERAGRFAADGRRVRRGIGLALVHHGGGFTGSGEVRLASTAAVDLTRDGRPRVLVASTDMGQGENTVLAQIVAHELGLPPEIVVVHTPDTAVVPDSGPTVASRTTMIVGGILERCARAMRAELEAFAGRASAGPVDFQRLARRYLARRGPLRIERRYQKPPEIEWDEQAYRGDAYPVFAYDCCVVDVEVDLDTCETRVVHVTTAVDLGKAIHPVLAAGQIEGGTVQALGYALLEEVRFQGGRVWNRELTNYIIPTSMDAPPVDVILVEEPYSRGPHGAKGVGELPFDAPAAAVLAAVEHATGARLAEIPVLPERLLGALRDKEPC